MPLFQLRNFVLSLQTFLHFSETTETDWMSLDRILFYADLHILTQVT